MLNMKRLVSSWIFAQKRGVDRPGYETHSWAVDEVINFASDKPDLLWETILEILDLDSSEEIIKAVGAGPLEDLMVYHGSQFIQKVDSQAEKSNVFKTAMQNVWLDSDDTSVYSKFYEIAGIEQPLAKK
ncbi:MAG: hypothetical protein V3V50_01985 [Gammaproteobacteria bacterium]